MADQDSDRSQQATPYKLQRARERGQVAKSRDVVSAAVFTAAMVYFAWRGWQAWHEQFALASGLLHQAAQMEPTPEKLWELVRQMVSGMLWTGLPFLAVLVLAAVIGNLVQTGAVLSFDPLKPDFNRLDPSEGIRRMFDVQTLFTLLRTLLKLVLLSLTAWLVLRHVVFEFFRLANLGPAEFLQALLDAMSSLGLKLAAVLWLIAAVDLVIARRQFANKMRMSRKELKDEVKQREGDPRIRARLRDLRREMRKRVMALRNTRNADVVITNPTHFAVALRYEHGRMQAPELVAKGAGLVAAAMRAIAARHRIPVVQNPPLARRLFHELDVERTLPGEFFADVARIFVWILAMKQARDRAAGAAA